MKRDPWWMKGNTDEEMFILNSCRNIISHELVNIPKSDYFSYHEQTWAIQEGLA